MRAILFAAVVLAGSVQAQTNAQMSGADLARRLNSEGPQVRASIQECYRSNVLRLGKGNAETADTLLRGVRSICKPLEDRLFVLYAPEIVGQARAEMAVGGVRSAAEDAAIAALLEERAKNPS